MLSINALGQQNTSRPRLDRNVTTVRQTAKRFFDVVVALSLAVAILPVIAVISALIAIDGGPVFYGHPRVGENGRSFEWRVSRKLLFDPQTTAIGQALCKKSLDGIPQLVNVFTRSFYQNYSRSQDVMSFAAHPTSNALVGVGFGKSKLA